MSDCQCPFTADEIEELKRLARREAEPYGRTLFDRSETVVRSCRISKRLYDDAILATGRDFTETVERALWQLLNHDESYLKPKK